jgi:glycosyltransferase involved in cell wall biosynthesis
MEIAGVRIPHRLMGHDRSMAYHDRQVAKLLRRSPQAFDVVHCWPGAALDTSRTALELGIAAVREVPNTHTANAYEVVGELCDKLGVELPKGHSHRMNTRRLASEDAEYSASLRLLVPSEHVKKTFVERGYPSEKLLRHRYGFDPRTFAPRDEPRSGPLQAIFLGSVDPRKGLHVALEAWRQAGAHNTAQFSIYGRVVDGYRSVIEPYLALPGVTLHDFTSDSAGALQSSDVLILPSFEEGSALVTYEAQGCGVVPLVSDASGAQCVHNVTGMVHKAGDVAALADHIRLLINDTDRLRTMQGAVMRNRESLTWDTAAEQLEHCYGMAREALSDAPRQQHYAA